MQKMPGQRTSSIVVHPQSKALQGLGGILASIGLDAQAGKKVASRADTTSAPVIETARITTTPRIGFQILIRRLLSNLR